ncbi:hypothetical protein ElyMa_006308100 [Elysia marginata]|uniref:Uncharacterized protein n=1 Tax=Elysia marginata TaxID=1093978 RepID=A0AAV4HGN1_9GAST|nr:hypothetical protein ElyMa_006308100 [Elysia marginata]
MDVSKQKSGIPVPQGTKKGKNGSAGNTERAEHDDQQIQTSARGKAAAQNPLAPAMTKKKTAKKNQMSESWADVKIESQSQKMKNQSQTDSSRRKEDIERQLQEAEKQIGALSEIIEKREKMLEDERSDAQKKFNELEDRLMDQEGVLAEHGIDPVSGQKVSGNDEDNKKLETTKKITKKTVHAMRAKLQEMNRQTESFLADIENTMQYLGSLEDASDRAGPFSEETQEMIARIANDEEAIKKVYDENKEPVKASDGGEESDEEVDSGEEKGGGDGSQFFITGAADVEKVVDDDGDDGSQVDTTGAKEMD